MFVLTRFKRLPSDLRAQTAADYMQSIDKCNQLRKHSGHNLNGLCTLAARCKIINWLDLLEVHHFYPFAREFWELRWPPVGGVRFTTLG